MKSSMKGNRVRLGASIGELFWNTKAYFDVCLLRSSTCVEIASRLEIMGAPQTAKSCLAHVHLLVSCSASKNLTSVVP